MESHEIRFSPVPVGVYFDGLALPDSLAALDAAHRAAFGDWAAAYAALADALAAVPATEADDRQALSDAVAAGMATPERLAPTAVQEALRAEEECKQLREAATDAAVALRAALAAASEELVPLAVQRIREAIDNHAAVMVQAKRDLAQTRADLDQALAALAVARPALARVQLVAPDFGTGAPSVQWPTDSVGVSLHARLDRLESDYARHVSILGAHSIGVNATHSGF